MTLTTEKLDPVILQLNLTTGNYAIRSWHKGDAPALARYGNNRKIWRNLRDAFPHPYRLADARSFLALEMSRRPETTFAIATDKEAIGAIGLAIGNDIHRYTAELGYWLAEPFWNRGIMTEAVTIFTGYAFSRYNLQRLYAESFTTNAPSARVLEKSGFRREALLRANAYKAGQVEDQFLFAKVRQYPD